MSKHIETGQQRGGSPIVFKSGEPVSVICVATTFTSLSYANNGGKVQITSAGVHGLTTSPAVGANVYVSWSGGTGVSGLYTVLSVDSTTSITVDLSYADGLGTPTVAIAGTEIYLGNIYTIPALEKNSKIRVTWGASCSKSTNAKTLFCYHGSSSVIAQVNTSTSIGLFGMVGIVSNQGDNGVQASTYLTPMPGSHTYNEFKPGSVDTTQTSTMRYSVKAAAANEFVEIAFYIVEVFI